MILLGYGAIALLFVLVVGVLQVTHRPEHDLTSYATGGRSFGSWYQTMSFLNTWLPGTIFISFAGLAAESGVIGFYYLPYSLLALLLMFFMARRVHEWGREFDLRTQSSLLGMRYGSGAVRVVAAVIGLVSGFPWIVLGMQSLGLVFSFLSFGRVGPTPAILIGIAVLSLRQVWTVRMGMRGIVLSDMVQGVVAYVLGICLVVGLLVWLATGGHGLAQVPASHYLLPGPGSVEGPLYLFSLVVTGALGGWCWPDIFARLFSAGSTGAIQRSAAQAAPILFVFASALTVLALLAGSLPEVAAAPDNVWFLVAQRAGPVVLALAGVIVLAASMGGVDGGVQATGTQVANDLFRVTSTRAARISIIAIAVLSAIGAAIATQLSSGLVTLAIVSYQGIVQLAPTLFLGIFWRRGTAAGALSGMLVGFGLAAGLQVAYPTSVPWAGGLTSGVIGLVVNAVLYVAVSLARPHGSAERDRMDALFARARAQDTVTTRV